MKEYALDLLRTILSSPLSPLEPVCQRWKLHTVHLLRCQKAVSGWKVWGTGLGISRCIQEKDDHQVPKKHGNIKERRQIFSSEHLSSHNHNTFCQNIYPFFQKMKPLKKNPNFDSKIIDLITTVLKIRNLLHKFFKAAKEHPHESISWAKAFEDSKERRRWQALFDIIWNIFNLPIVLSTLILNFAMFRVLTISEADKC